MEYLVVRFETARRVMINGNPGGLTNTLIQVEAGTHTVTLAPPADFAPPTLTVVVVDTSALAPLTVSFAPALSPAAPPPKPTAPPTKPAAPPPPRKPA